MCSSVMSGSEDRSATMGISRKAYSRPAVLRAVQEVLRENTKRRVVGQAVHHRSNIEADLATRRDRQPSDFAP